jgi:hypothetical protein
MLKDFIVNSYQVDRALNTKNIILTFITGEFCTLLLNWYKHLQKLGINDNVIVVCLDATAYTYAVEHGMTCMYVDQETLVNSEDEEVFLLRKAYKEKHHICKAYCIGHIACENNINVIHSDIDMIFLKVPFDRLSKLITEKYDIGAYMDLSYEELTSGIPREKGGFGFIIFYATPTWYPKFLDQLRKDPLCIDDNDVGQAVMQKHFKEIKSRWLNSFLFTNYNIWKVKEVQDNIRNICYCIHYNTSENTWMYKMTNERIERRNNTKIERMKEYGHWLL